MASRLGRPLLSTNPLILPCSSLISGSSSTSSLSLSKWGLSPKLRPDMRLLFASCVQVFTWACLPRLNITLTNCVRVRPASPSFRKSSRIVINSEAGRRIIVLVATSEGMVVVGPSRVGLAFLLLPAGPAVVVVDGYALFGLPPPGGPRVGCRGSSGAIELGLSCGAVELGRLALVICPSTCPLWAEESLDGSCTSFRVEQRRV